MNEHKNLLEQRAALIGAMDNPVLYDLGCGQAREKDFIGIDLTATGPGIINADLYTYPWTLADNSVDYFRSSHFVEHVPDWDAHFTEIYRCLKPGGYYEITGPYYLSRRFFQDPDHKNALLEPKFWYLNAEWRKGQKLEHYGAKVHLVIAGWYELLHDDFMGMSDDALAWHRLHSFNVVEDIAVILRKDAMPE